MRRWRPLALALTFGATLCLSAPASAQSVAEAFGAMQDSIGRARAAMPEDARVRRIFAQVVYLQGLSPRLRPEDAPDFARSLRHDAALLDEAVAATEAERAEILADVEADLEVKQSAGAGLGAGTAFPGRVAVTVVTRRRGSLADAPGYVITMNPVRWRGREPMFRLPRLSPATARVPPGRYEVVAFDGNSRVAGDILRIGLDAEDDVTVELPVP